MDINERKRYAKQWVESSKFFYNNKDYDWMCNQIEQYNVVLEIGSGTGHSTLSLIEHGHKVIAIEKNEYCFEKAKELIENRGYICGTLNDRIDNCDAILILGDICDKDLLKRLYEVSFDIVVCWNIGTYWSKNMFQFYLPKFLEYGLTVGQIQENVESSYAEYIQWCSCNIAKEHRVPIHYIDRNGTILSEADDPYYVSLKDEFSYANIKYDSIKSVSKSLKGRPLKNSEKLMTNEYVEIVLISILLTL
jgi:SAM-dependent methyltransferase